MNEIERRWLIDPHFASVLSANCKRNKDITQCYIASTKDCSVRIRRETSYETCLRVEYFLAIKTGSGLTRREIENKIDENLYNNLQVDNLYYLKKTRSYIDLDGVYTAELDAFHGPLDGHYQIEVEFESEEEANNFLPPYWFGIDVTENPRYINANLAKDGLPRW